MPPLHKTFIQISALDLQTDELKFDSEWKWKVVSVETVKEFGISKTTQYPKNDSQGSPNDMVGIEAAQQNAERDCQARRRRQTCIDCSLEGLRLRYLQRKAQEYSMENPIATWNEFSTRIIRRDVSFQVSLNLLNNEGQNKTQWLH